MRRIGVRAIKRTVQSRNETDLPSGGVLSKGKENTSTRDIVSEEDLKQARKKEKGMWFLKDNQRGGISNPMAPYEPRNGGDKGLPFSTRGGKEFDVSEPSEAEMKDLVKKGIVATPVSPERREKQLQLLNKTKTRKALATLLSDEEGMVTVKHDEGVILVDILPSRGRITGGLIKQFNDLLEQLGHMRDVTGIVFNIKGSLTGVPDQNECGADAATAFEAVANIQRVGVNLWNTNVVTICSFEHELSGIGLEIFLFCDFMFAGPTASIHYSAPVHSQTGVVGGLTNLARRTNPRTALLVATSPSPIPAETCVSLSLLDRIAKNPKDAAKKFLKSLPEENWDQTRKMKDIAVTMEQLEMTEAMIKEQFHFRKSWNSVKHKERVDDYQRSM